MTTGEKYHEIHLIKTELKALTSRLEVFREPRDAPGHHYVWYAICDMTDAAETLDHALKDF